MKTIAENLTALKQGKDDMNTALVKVGTIRSDNIEDISGLLNEVPVVDATVEEQCLTRLLSNTPGLVVIPKGITTLKQYCFRRDFSNEGWDFNLCGLTSIGGNSFWNENDQSVFGGSLKLYSTTAENTRVFRGLNTLNNLYYGSFSSFIKSKHYESTYDNRIENPIYLARNGNIYIEGTLLGDDLVIPDGITSIYANKFCYLKSTGFLYIPKSVSVIGAFAFVGCKFTDVYFENDTNPPTLTSLSKSGVYYYRNLYMENAKIHVPVGCVDLYKEAWAGVDVEAVDYPAFYTYLDEIIDDNWSNYTPSPTPPPKELKSNLQTLIESNQDIREVLISKGVDLSNKNWSNYGEIIEDLKSDIHNQSYVNYINMSGEVTVPQSCTSLSGYSFRYRNGITSIILHSGVTSIAYLGTIGISTLDNVIVNNGIYDSTTYFSTNSRGEECKCLMTRVNGLLVLLWGTNKTRNGGNTDNEDGVIVIPDGVERISPGCFNSRKIRDIYFPQSFSGTISHSNWTVDISSYYEGNFNAYFTSLSQISGLTTHGTGNGDTWITGHYLYIGGTKITDLDFTNSGISEIKQGAFKYTRGLNSITFSGVSTIRDTAFMSCGTIPSVYINSAISLTVRSTNSSFNGTPVTNVYYSNFDVFYGSNGWGNTSNLYVGGTLLQGDFIIREGVTTVKPWFNHNKNMTSITIPSTATSIASFSFEYCSITNLYFSEGSQLSEISNYSLSRISSLQSLNLPSSVWRITQYGIEYTGMTSFTWFPASSNGTIADRTIQYCTALETVELGSKVISIQSMAFRGDTSLRSFTIHNATPPTLGTDVFIDTNDTFKIFVPAESVEAYKGATNWSAYASHIEAIPTT